MNNTIKKTSVLAMAMAMTVSAGLPAYAETLVTTAAPVVETTTVLETNPAAKVKARKYFANYPAEGKYNVSADAFLERVASKEKLCVIDIRDAVDYNAGHIKGAVNIPYGTDIAKKLSYIPDNVPVLVYCYSGQTASQTTALLRIAGKDAYNVSGGWKNGISKSAKVKAFTTTEAKKLSTSTSYYVPSSVIEAVEEYYELAVENGKFNMSPAAVKEALEKDEIYLLDVRSKNDHLKTWIDGVDKNIPFGNGMQESFSSLPRNKKIAVQCYSGQTASQVVAVLRVLGYDAYTMSGGTGAVGGSGWLGAGFEMKSATTQEFLNAKVADYFANLPANKNQVSAAAFLADIDKNRDVYIIDIRDKADYENGHIRYAVNIPYGTDIAANLEKIPNDKPVYVYCYSGQTASQTVMLLNLAGKKAINVSGGWNNGISKEKAHEDLLRTVKYPVKDAKYSVDADISAAIKTYYENIAKEETNKKGNISVANVKAVLDAKDETYQVVDVRSAADFAKGHIEGAINVPYGKDMQKLFNTIPSDKTILLHCYSGQTASQTMAALRVMGYKVYNISGGANGITSAGTIKFVK